MQSTHEDVVVEVLQQMIRNACVNDGSPDSGFEARNVDVLRALLEGPGIEVETYESRPGRNNLVARIAGTSPLRRRCAGLRTPTSCRSIPTVGTTTPSGANSSTETSGDAAPLTCLI